MRYVSTRGQVPGAAPAQAIAVGLAPDGGLYAPETLPRLPARFWEELAGRPYPDRVSAVLSLFLPEFPRADLYAAASRAYGAERFDGGNAAPVVPLEDGLYLLNLWHGPTAAFKDMALQLLPYLLTESLRRVGETRDICILAATSGDTGKAALEGFRDVPGTRVLVFYPKDGVSAVQERQMTSQQGTNVGVLAVSGNFDDTQRGVKAIFGSHAAAREADRRGWAFSSANSINLGRLLPQVAYYVSAYCDMVGRGAVRGGDPVHVCVPTGNFGNILSAYMAAGMGVPFGRLLCASNSNNVLTDFIRDGVYDRNRTLRRTLSPSMDILVSSNVERFLFLLSGLDGDWVRDCMNRLAETGRYELPDALKGRLKEHFAAAWADDDATRRVIASVYRGAGTLVDPHTAVGISLGRAFRDSAGDGPPILVVSTASPFKFPEAVLAALGETAPDDPRRAADALSRVTRRAPPRSLRDVFDRAVRFRDCIRPEEMEQAALAFLDRPPERNL